MRLLTKLQGVCLVLIIVISACSQQIRPKNTTFPEAQTQPPNGFSFVEALATGTEVALTEIAQTPVVDTKTRDATVIATVQEKSIPFTPVVITHGSASFPPVLMIILTNGERHTFTYSFLEQISDHTRSVSGRSYPAIFLRSLLEQISWQADSTYSITLEGLTSATFLVSQLPKDAALYLDYGSLGFNSIEILDSESPRDVVLIVLH